MILPNDEEVTSLHKSNVVMVRDRSPPSWNRRLNVLVEYPVQYYVTARVIKSPRKQRLEGKRTSCSSWKSRTTIPPVCVGALLIQFFFSGMNPDENPDAGFKGDVRALFWGTEQQFALMLLHPSARFCVPESDRMASAQLCKDSFGTKFDTIKTFCEGERDFPASRARRRQRAVKEEISTERQDWAQKCYPEMGYILLRQWQIKKSLYLVSPLFRDLEKYDAHVLMFQPTLHSYCISPARSHSIQNHVCNVKHVASDVFPIYQLFH